MTKSQNISVIINGEPISASVPLRTNLVDFLRNQVGLTGSHVGCEHGVCGACTLEVDGSMIRGCLMLAVQADGAEITTIEGFADREKAAQLQLSFQKYNALQCGYCTPGMLASALEYIEAGGKADRAAIRQHLSGNYCRCTGYQSIVDAVVAVIEQGGKQ
ncbi:MAG: 2Fe-2S iron-sulfur cluster binding domain-containing protein [Rhizobiaceae bacterium]|nr:2Fe-2S iron-sulfur cluster binding domain-containing protein [Rhizobiaceae bacterium]